MTDSEQKLIWAACLRMLAASPKSRNELARRLVDKGYSNPIIKWALDELEAKGILNDKTLAANVVSQFVNAKPSGKRKISFELKRKGVSAQVCEEVLAGLDGEDEKERARELFLSRWEKYSNLEPEKRRKKTFDFLMRRGFEYQTVKELMTQCGGTDDADD